MTVNGIPERIIVAVDGPAGSGKSSVCRKVALDKGLKYIDSGAIYRTITWYFINKYEILPLADNLKDELYNIEVSQVFEQSGIVQTFINGKDVSRLIREERIAQNISHFSDSLVVREYVNTLLRGWAGCNSIIMDGRDIGTVVFPHAHLKIYLDASIEERTGRRVKEYSEMGKNVDENFIRNQIIQRDSKDRMREHAPLVRARDAVYIDTSLMSFDSVVEKIETLIMKTVNMI